MSVGYLDRRILARTTALYHGKRHATIDMGYVNTVAVCLEHVAQTSLRRSFVTAPATDLLGIHPCPDVRVLCVERSWRCRCVFDGEHEAFF